MQREPISEVVSVALWRPLRDPRSIANARQAMNRVLIGLSALHAVLLGFWGSAGGRSDLAEILALSLLTVLIWLFLIVVIVRRLMVWWRFGNE